VQQTFDIHSQTSGLNSKALVSSCGKIRFNINEPSSSNSQIQQFLDLNRGAGIQHIALQTNDIFRTIDRMRQQQLAFLAIDPIYYTQLQLRAKTAQNLALTDRELQQVQNLHILADWSESDPEAVLLQIFTQPIFEAPTFFFEIIERRNRAKGFGRGNFQALFEAIEQNLAA
jgi:4-hydroxyphenylpyruvate dioxygenase